MAAPHNSSPIDDAKSIDDVKRAMRAQLMAARAGRGLPLSFRLWQPGDPLVAERFGTMRPAGEERLPEFLLVP
jgi:hypothetical protein